MRKPLEMAEVEKMREVGRLAARVLRETGEKAKAGVTTNELDEFAHKLTLELGCEPAPLNYNGFPKSICTSVNECVCHGVPDDRPLEDGDIINIDITCIKDGFYGDTSRTFFIGEVSDEAKRITAAAEEAMMKGIEVVGPGATTGDIGFAINKFVTRQGYYVVEEIGGHGIGRKFHEDPFVPSFGKKGKGDKLQPWTCITVEPMINETHMPIKEFEIPNSTIKYYETGDKSLTAQFEHTVLITDSGYEIMTKEDI